MLKDNGAFGFIKQDSSEENIFVIPGACISQRLPAVGSRVTYDAVVDQKTGRVRAESVAVEADSDGLDRNGSQPVDWNLELGVFQSGGFEASEFGGLAGNSSASSADVNAPGDKQTGVMLSTQGKYGFIKQDSGEENMFVLPLACTGFGGELPPIGCRVKYGVAIDDKTGRPKADEVEPLDPSQGLERGFKRPRDHYWTMEENGRSVASRHDAYSSPSDGFKASASRSGVMQTIVSHGKFGFILEDSGGDMFVIPSTCEGGVFPAIGARVTYDVVTDAVTGRPRAENVRSQPGAFSGNSWGSTQDQWWGKGGKGPIGAPIGAPQPRLYGPASGSFERYPPVHQSPRVPALSSPRSHGPFAPTSAYPALGPPPAPAAAAAWGRASGTMLSDNGKFGFIQQDSGEENMFVMPSACQGFGGMLPPLGSRVTYAIVVDSKTGRPRAEEVAPETTFATGTMLVDSGKFGFIQQDSGEENMFVMPKACASLGSVLPQLGARVGYEVVLDEKTGRPRAENVHLIQW